MFQLSGLLEDFVSWQKQFGYLVLSGMFLIASKICELLRSYQEYPAKSVGKKREEFLIAALVKS
jgi:hypothetical protein